MRYRRGGDDPESRAVHGFELMWHAEAFHGRRSDTVLASRPEGVKRMSMIFLNAGEKTWLRRSRDVPIFREMPSHVEFR